MPLVGGGGAPNTAGGNPTGTGTSINYVRVGDKTFAYAYSGIVSVPHNAFTTLLKFTSGTNTLVMQLTPQYMEDTLTGTDTQFRISLNSERIMQLDGDQSATDHDVPIPIIIPPYSSFEITAQAMSGSSTINLGCAIVGEVYA